MNLDELKSAWNSEPTREVKIPENVKQLRKAMHPLDKLKRNMKNEWFLQIAAVITLGFAPQLHKFYSSLYPLYYVAYGFMVIVSVYYLGQFRKFYEKIIHYSGDTKDSLTRIHDEFRLNIKRYHAFGFLLLPYGLVWIGIFIYSNLLEKGRDFSNLTAKTKILLSLSIIAILLLLIFAILGWTKHYYGRYLNQIKSVLEELNEK